MTTVSVIIPTYNCANRLVQALGSVARQTLSHEQMEVLVVDDGSTDETREQVDKFTASTDIVVKYVWQHNAGPASARNHGIRLSRGSVIAFLDDDDLWFPGKLERQLPLLKHNVGLVYCDNTFADANGVLLPNYVRRVSMVRGDVRLALFCDLFLMTPAICILRSCVDRVGFFNERLAVGEDYEYWLRVVAGFDVDFVDEKLWIRTVRPGSLSRRDYELDFRTDLETLQGFLEAHPDFAACNRVAVRRRLADLRHSFAYSLLKHGRRREALLQLSRSLLTRPSIRAFKTSVRTVLPM